MSHDIGDDSNGVLIEELGHAVPLRVLLGVFAVLLTLTFVTVAATWFDFGGWAIMIALGIATLKASLVALYFMHLRYEKRLLIRILMPIVVITLAIFIGLTYTDILYR